MLRIERINKMQNSDSQDYSIFCDVPQSVSPWCRWLRAIL